MAKGDLQAVFEEIVSKLKNRKEVKPRGGVRSFRACCPAHEDASPSFIVTLTSNRVLVYCHAGCARAKIEEALGVQGKLSGHTAMPGISINRLATVKNLDPDLLRATCHLVDREQGGVDVISIPYLDRAGTVMYTKTRSHLSARLGSREQAGVTKAPYGLWRLDEFLAAGHKHLFVVEGETDLWAMWQNGHPAIALPGSGSHGALTAAMFAGFDTVYVWRDKDAGAGVKFVKGVAERIASFLLPVRVLAVYHDTFKDPCDIQARTDDFGAVFNPCVAAAKPVAEATTLFSSPPDEPPGRWGLPVRFLPFGQLGYEYRDIAERVARLYGDSIRYFPESDQWYRFDGRRWEVVRNEGCPRAYVYTAADGLRCEANTITGDSAEDLDARTAVLAAREAVAKKNTVFDIVRHLKCEPAVRSTPDDFDLHPGLINFPNGTFDLATGARRDHAPEDRITHVMGAPYDPDARCPTWLKFLGDVTRNDAQTLAYLQEVCGYTATGYTREHCLFFLYGPGSNGKSSFVSAVEAAMGTYARRLKSETLVSNQTDRAFYDYAHLPGRRMVPCSELPTDGYLNEALVKDLTSEERITGRLMRQDFFEFDPTHKLWLMGNHKPAIRGQDDGIWRRIRLIGFEVTIPEAQRDPDLKAKLRAELPGICAWIVQGAVRWYRRGHLITPEKVRSATRDYREECDILSDWMEDCAQVDAGESVRALDAYRSYAQWSRRIGETRPMGRNTFYRNLEARGYPVSRDGGTRRIKGLHLTEYVHAPSEFQEFDDHWNPK